MNSPSRARCSGVHVSVHSERQARALEMRLIARKPPLMAGVAEGNGHCSSLLFPAWLWLIDIPAQHIGEGLETMATWVQAASCAPGALNLRETWLHLPENNEAASKRSQVSLMAAVHVSVAIPGHVVTQAPAGRPGTGQLGGHRPHWPRD